ncbi:unannotated protein [freshwater metagenome]|uniref:Unannotated protein n=1 Tax=freshwater metagenome TaxID=449393 RepID=A0A6J7E6N6_9ZZZZ
MWQVQVDRGRAETFHGRDMPVVVEPSVWWFEVDRPALVLGSAQPIGHIDVEACERAGVDVVRRRSGGGAVLLRPDEVLWADILIPADSPLWTPDVSSSAWWLGEAWREALTTLGMDDLHVHRAPMQRSEWSAQVCFAGVGGGEVMLGRRKVVGISQRRTRAGARLQCAVYRQWQPEAHVPLFAAPGPTLDALADCVAPVPMPFAEIRRALLDALEALAG